MAINAVEGCDEVAFQTCSNGHPQTDENVVWTKAGKQGKAYPRCRLCRNAAVRRVAARKRGEDVPKMPSFISPRAQHASIEPPPARTRPLFSMLPPNLRITVYAVIADGRGDPMALRALRVASEQRAWSGLGESFATISFIEAVIEQVRDSRSLRLDRVLALLYQEPP